MEIVCILIGFIIGMLLTFYACRHERRELLEKNEQLQQEINQLKNNKTMNINPNQQSSESQCAQIRAWLESGNTITALEALNLFGCMRLPSRIHDLKRQGCNIISKTIILTNGKRVSQYSIPQAEA